MAVQPEEALVTLLIADADVNALVAGRIIPVLAEDTAVKPYLVYQRITTEHAGYMTGQSGLGRAGIQLNGYATTEKAMQDLREKCRAALNNKRPGSVTVGEGGSINIHSIWMTADRDVPVVGVAASGVALFGFQQDYTVSHFEAVAA